MATQIGELFVRIGAETSSLQKGFLNAELSTKNLKAGFDKLKAAAPYAIAAVAAVGAALVVNLVKNTMASIDAQAKLARQLDTSIEGLVTMQMAANHAGIATEQMNQMLSQLNIKLGEANKGAGPAAEALEKLGLTVKDLAELDADEKIIAIMDALEDSVPATDQAQVLNDLFGEIGQKLKNLDAEAIAKAAKEVEALGLAVSEKDAQTIERAGDAIYTIQQVFQGMANKITTKLAPVIEGIAVAFKDWAIETRGFADTFESVVNGVMTGVRWIANAFWGLGAVWEGLKAGAAALKAFWATIFEWIANRILDIVILFRNQINKIIEWANKIPGVEMAPISIEGIEKARQQIADMQDSTVNQMKDATDAMLEYWSGQPWGDRMMKAIEEANGKSDALFKMPDKDKPPPGPDDPDAENRRKEREQRLQEIRDRFKDEQTLAEEQHEEEMEFLRQAHEDKLVGDLEYMVRKEQLEQEHAARVKAIREQAVRDEVGISKRGWLDQLRNQSNAMKAMLADLRGNLDVLFADNKAYKTAMAIVDGIQAIQASYAFGAEVGGPILGAAMAAIAAAATWKNIQAINAVQPGSKSGGGGGGGGPTPAPVATAPSPQEETGGGSRGWATINIVGGDAATFTGKQVRDLIEQINEEVGNGMNIRVA